MSGSAASAFDKLYEDAVSRRQRAAERATAAAAEERKGHTFQVGGYSAQLTAHIPTSSTAHSDALYRQAEERRKRASSRAEAEAAARESEIQTLPFKPEISAAARALVVHGSFEERAARYAEERARRAAELEARVAEDRDADLTFRPDISLSQSYVAPSSRDHDVLDVMEKEEAATQARMAEFESMYDESKTYPFAPSISAYSKSLVREGEVHDRLYQEAAARRERREIEARIAAAKVVQNPHSPTIHAYHAPGDANTSNRRLMKAVRSYLAGDASDVRLYDEAKFLSVKRRVAFERERSLRERHANMPKISKNSVALYRKRLAERLQVVFDDNARDGRLTTTGLKTALIDLGLFAPDGPAKSTGAKLNEDELAFDLFSYLTQGNDSQNGSGEGGARNVPLEPFRAFFVRAFDVTMTADPVHSSKLRISTKMLGLDEKPLAQPLTSMLYNFNEQLPETAEEEDLLSHLMDGFRRICRNELAFALTSTIKMGRGDEGEEKGAANDGMDECTFRPKINAPSTAEGEAAASDPLLHANELYRKAQEAESKKKVARLMHAQKEMAACTFRPKVNAAASSEISAPVRRHLKSKHDRRHEAEIERAAARGRGKVKAVESAVVAARNLADSIAPLPGMGSGKGKGKGKRATGRAGKGKRRAGKRGGGKKKRRQRKGGAAAGPVVPKGYDEAVMRLRRAKAVREEKIVREAPRGSMFDTLRAAENGANGVSKPNNGGVSGMDRTFEGFSAPASSNAPVRTHRKVRTVTAHLPDLLVQIKLGGGRTTKIPLSLGDDPVQVAKDVALANGLDRDLRAKLIAVLKSELSKLYRRNKRGAGPSSGRQEEEAQVAAEEEEVRRVVEEEQEEVRRMVGGGGGGAGGGVLEGYVPSFGAGQTELVDRGVEERVALGELSEDSFECSDDGAYVGGAGGGAAWRGGTGSALVSEFLGELDQASSDV